MLDELAWSRLIAGLHEATTAGRLRWARSVDSGLGVYNGAMSAIMSAPSLTAQRGKARFELSASRGGMYGLAPYELTVWEMKGATLEAVDTLRSSTSVLTGGSLQLNQALEALYQLANASIENPSEVVDRILGQLD